jgi:nicotinic acid mononucleotide adenylyltransferase
MGGRGHTRRGWRRVLGDYYEEVEAGHGAQYRRTSLVWQPGAVASALVGVYPGTFNPLTVAHLAIATAAHAQCGLDHLDLAVSRSPLAKAVVEVPTFDHRVAVLETVAARLGWLGVVVTDHQLLADVAEGYDVLVIGADKWAQLVDPRYYGDSVTARDLALTRLPRRLAVAARPPFAVPAHAELLDLDPDVAEVSSTAVRGGRREWMAPEAAAFDEATGAWTDPERYASTVF